MPSSHRSSSIPSSFDRIRVTSIQFLSPFRNHHERHRQPSPERSWIRKIQVHPNNINSSDSQGVDHKTTNLFHAKKQSNIKTSLLSKMKKSSNNLLNTRPTSNVVGVCEVCKLSVTNACCSSESEVPKDVCSTTPCMIRDRNASLPTLVPTRVIKQHPKSLRSSNEQFDFD